MSSVVIVGSQWGDEGKGKVVDILTEKANLVVRFQGGNNAGHTLVVGDETYALHLVPSGILHSDKLSVVASGVVIDPAVFIKEITTLQKRGLKVSPDNLMVSEKAHLILPYHTALDKAREGIKGDSKIGTTGRGIGPAYEDKAARIGLRMHDLLDLDEFAVKIKAALYEKNHLLKELYKVATVDFNEIMKEAKAWAEILKPFIGNTFLAIQNAFDQNKNILFEGAQGVQLDIDHGNYPFVTSSNPVAGAVCTGAGVAPRQINGILALVKAYSTRVGGGPFPTELFDKNGDYLRDKGHEYGTTTGRPRRCGWLDAVVVREGVRLCGADHLALTKLDVLAGLPELKIATHYLLDGEKINHIPADHRAFARCQPVYKSYQGFDGNLSKVKKLADLPKAARIYLDELAELCGAPLGIVSIGPDREETILLHSYF